MTIVKDREFDSVQYGSNHIEYTCIEAERKTLGITVLPDMQVLVSAPTGTEREFIRARVQKKARWIIQKQEYFSQFFPRTPERQYIGGETHLYLGRQYRLKLIKSESPLVKLSGRYILVQNSNTQPESVRTLLEQWYKERAKIKFPERLGVCSQDFEKYNIVLPELLIREMSRRWGSLTPNKRIILNTELIKTPMSCIDYVITHELCHLLVPEHNSKFYKLLSTMMDDWEARKNRLEKLLMQ